METKKNVKPGKIVTKVVLTSLLYQILFNILSGFLLGSLEEGLGEVLFTIVNKIASIAVIIIAYKLAIDKVLKEYTTARENIHKMIKSMMIWMVVSFILIIGMEVLAIGALKVALPETIEQFESLAKFAEYTDEEVATKIQEIKDAFDKQIKVTLVSSAVTLVIDLFVNLWIIKYFKEQLSLKIEPAKAEYEEETLTGNGLTGLVVALVIVVTLGVGILLSSSWDVLVKPEDKLPDETNKENIEDVVNKEEAEDNTALYDKFKNIIWSDNISDNYEVKDGKIYYLEENIDNLKEEKVIKIETITVGENQVVYVTTKDGKAWKLNNSTETEGEVVKTRLLEDEQIVDMTLIKTFASQTSDDVVYFLTQSGKLVDENGVSYNKYKFKQKVTFNGTNIPIDGNNYGYHYNSKDNKYTTIVNKSNSKITFGKVYEVEGKLLIQTEYNKLFEYTGKSNKLTQVGGTVKDTRIVTEEENINLAITFSDGMTKIYEGATVAYNVKKKKNIDVASLEEYTYTGLVKDAINKYDPQAAKDNCGDIENAEDLILSIKAPKITLMTSNVEKVNKQIYDKYNKMKINTSKGGYNLIVDYTSSYVSSKKLLNVSIKEIYEAMCATGGENYESYVYDIENDKFLNLSAVLEKYDITTSTLKTKIKNAYKKEYEETMTNSEIDKLIKNNEIKIIKLGKDYITVHVPVAIIGIDVKITK